MSTRTVKPLRFFVLILLMIAVLISCGKSDMNGQNTLNAFSQMLEDETIGSLRLKIYYMSPFILTRYPLSVEDLIHDSEAQEIIVDGSLLEEHIDLLKQLTPDILVPVKNASFLNSRMCYIFETDNGERILEVAFGGLNGVFVNGVEVESNYLFFYIVKPFFTEDAMNVSGKYYDQEVPPTENFTR